MLENLTLKQKIIFFIILFIMIIFILYYMYVSIYKQNSTFTYYNENYLYDEFINNTITDNNLTINSNNFIIVYICGAVNENKNVTLEEGSRILDAIEAAGGLTEEADLTNINLAYILEDGEKIYIPKKGDEIDNYPIDINVEESTSHKNSKININKASQVELETIPGIGPSTAIKIINYRKENGKFSSIEDIKNISGIGDSKYEKIKEFITV